MTDNQFYCMGCNQYVSHCENGTHIMPSPLWTEEDIPYQCGPVYADKETALLSTVKEQLNDVDSLLNSDEEWAENALWVALVEPGGLIESVRMWVNHHD